MGYREIADDLRARILASEFLPGNKLGTEKQLAWEYNVGVWTVGNAIDLLRREGFVEPWRRGVVAVVADRPAKREVLYRGAGAVESRPATVADVGHAVDEPIEPGMPVLVVEVGDDVFVYRSETTKVRFH